MKNLVLITSQFPFGKGETFVSSEFPFLARAFDKIIVIAQNVSFEKTRETSSNTTVHRYNPATSIAGFMILPFVILANIPVIVRLYTEEISFRGNIDFRYKKDLVRKIIKAIQLRRFLKKILSREKINDSIVFYSYWLKTGAHAISLLNYRNSIKISRAHGSDLYEERTESGYLPLLRFSAQNLDTIFFTSQHGKKYFEKKTGQGKAGYLVSYLGTLNPYSESVSESKANEYRIVSCSNMIPLKRIDMIIDALSQISSKKAIIWKHFGDGGLMYELKELATRKLENKIMFSFIGYYPNYDLLKFYNTSHVDLFINASSTEGIPVSIMEAQSFGIPVVATDTGAVREVVIEGTGSLLPVNCSAADLAHTIEQYIDLDERQIESIRKNAIMNWKSNFNADSNYSDFIKKVNSIFASANK